MTEFKREERFIVVKRSDFVTQRDEQALRGWLEKFCVPTRECVVVEADWPIYEQVWDMVQRVAEGRPQKVAELESLLKDWAALKGVPIDLAEDYHHLMGDCLDQGCPHHYGDDP